MSKTEEGFIPDDPIVGICYRSDDQDEILALTKASWPKDGVIQDILIECPGKEDVMGDVQHPSFKKFILNRLLFYCDTILSSKMGSKYVFFDTDIWFFQNPFPILSKCLDDCPIWVQGQYANYKIPSKIGCLGVLAVKVTEETIAVFDKLRNQVYSSLMSKSYEFADNLDFNIQTYFFSRYALLNPGLFASNASGGTQIDEHPYLYHATNTVGIKSKIENIVSVLTSRGIHVGQ